MSKFQISFIGYILVLFGVALYWGKEDVEVMLSLYVCVSFIYSVFLFVMSMMIRSNFYLKAIHQNTSNKVILSFDDGPHPTETLKVLDVLDKYQIKALFFMIGENVVAYPEIAKEVVIRGHQVGIHSQNHSGAFGFLVGASLKNELTQCQQEIIRITGVETKLFRPPFGITNPNIARVTNRLGLQVIGWNVRSFDTVTKSSEILIERVVSGVESNSIILLHDRLEQTTEALPEIIEKVNSMKFTFGIIENK